MNSHAASAGWAQRRERGVYFLMRITYACAGLLRRWPLRFVLHLIVGYFFLFGRGARDASLDYLRRLGACAPELALRSDWRTSYRHVLAFSEAMLDKLDAWRGRLNLDRVDFENYAQLRAAADGGRGMLLIGSHLGNLEVCRALAHLNRRARLNVLVHTRHAASFNRLLNESGASSVELIQVTEVGPDTAILLAQKVAAGEWVVIAGDRVPVGGGRTASVNFLGAATLLPQGPYLLAGLFECPVFLVFCLRQGSRYRVIVEQFAERIRWTRATRNGVIAEHAQRYAARLEHYCRRAPLQWFNFFPFWPTSSDSKP